ncbi:VOC family protein [Telmatospirillum sp. J64-1]|uniref:VOC family protein n=1 Tax=Telmatospirillum sp. J64-1 TaxID=2502183 RepID=UPI00115D5123|nr:VOC family protein [Telmatospirillum sp. J64-1]
MEQRLSLVTLGVADLKRSRAFYERLGWRESAAGNEEVAFYQAGGTVLGLFGRQDLAEDAGLTLAGHGEVPAFSGVTLAHNVPAREDVARVLAEAEAAGARILKHAQDTSWGGHHGYFADPDSHLWEVAWNPFFPLDEQGNITLP